MPMDCEMPEPRGPDVVSMPGTVPLKTPSELAQRLQLFYGEIPSVRECGVLHRTNVTIRKHETIAIGPMRLLRVVAKNVEIEGGKDFRHIKRSGNVSRTRA